MGRECPNRIEEFDSFFSTRQLKLMKLFLPYIAPALRRKLMIYIKYREWQITIQYLSRPLLFSELQLHGWHGAGYGFFQFHVSNV